MSPEPAERLIVVCGLPGVGKTSVAAVVAGRMRAVHLSIDAIEETLLGSGLPAGWQVGVAAYEAARAIAELNLRLGHVVVVDAVNDSEEARQTWRSAADAVGAGLLLVTSDEREHERRLLGRNRGFSHVSEPTWADVHRRRAEYAPWTDDHVEIDTSSQTLHEIADAVVARIGVTRPSATSGSASEMLGYHPRRPGETDGDMA